MRSSSYRNRTLMPDNGSAGNIPLIRFSNNFNFRENDLQIDNDHAGFLLFASKQASEQAFIYKGLLQPAGVYPPSGCAFTEPRNREFSWS